MGHQVVVDGHRVFTSKKSTRRTGEAFEGTVDLKIGYIDYILYPKIKVVVFNGSFIEREYRGQGKYKVLVKQLLRRWPGYEFQCLAVSRLVVYTLTKRFGFKITNHPLFFWGTTGGKPGEYKEMELYPGANKGRKRTCWRLKRGKYTKKGT